MDFHPPTDYDDDPRTLRVTCGWSAIDSNGDVWYIKPLTLSNGFTALLTDGSTTPIVGWELVSADRKKRLEILETVSPDRAFEAILGPPVAEPPAGVEGHHIGRLAAAS